MRNGKTILILIIIIFSLVGMIAALKEKPVAEENVVAIEREDIKEKLSNNEDVIEEEKASSDKKLVNDIVDSFTYEPLPQEVISKIDGVSWNSEAPVSLDDLSYVKVLYWGFDEQEHTGELIVHKKVAKEVVQIFKELYKAKFPIEKIRLIDEYNANDDLSMEDNNTSAFCFRKVAGKKTLSKHSYGIAIDINTVQNPYVENDRVSPKAGEEYSDRTNVRKGMIVKDDVCYKAFKERGWIWGGEWKTIKDYQHFEKKIDLEDLK